MARYQSRVLLAAAPDADWRAPISRTFPENVALPTATTMIGRIDVVAQRWNRRDALRGLCSRLKPAVRLRGNAPAETRAGGSRRGRATAPSRGDLRSASSFRADCARARSCAVHVVRHGALAHLDESGRRSPVEPAHGAPYARRVKRGTGTHRESRNRLPSTALGRRFRRRRDASRRLVRRITSR